VRNWGQTRFRSGRIVKVRRSYANMIDDDRNDPACNEQRDDRVAEQAEVAVEIGYEVPERARKFESANNPKVSMPPITKATDAEIEVMVKL
jgi:hypothetical protein